MENNCKKIKNKMGIDTIDLWVIAITAYGIFQGVYTILNVGKKLSVARMSQMLAAIHIYLFIVSLCVIFGAFGLVYLKKWGLFVTRYSYMAVILLISQIFNINRESTLFFLMFRRFDMLIAVSILIYLTKKQVVSKFI